jgi:hypothetical protein
MRKVCVRRASPPGGVRTFAAGLAIGLICSLSACGGSGSSGSQSQSQTRQTASLPVCRPAGRTIVALARNVAAAQVISSKATGNNGAPECHFATTAAGRRVTVIVNVDSSPQPYARLERAIVEDGQQFGTRRTFAAPQTVTHLGLDASWIPDLDQLLTSDGHVLLAVTVHWPRAAAAARRDLATALARVYLGTPDPALAKGPAPSG